MLIVFISNLAKLIKVWFDFNGISFSQTQKKITNYS